VKHYNLSAVPRTASGGVSADVSGAAATVSSSPTIARRLTGSQNPAQVWRSVADSGGDQRQPPRDAEARRHPSVISGESFESGAAAAGASVDHERYSPPVQPPRSLPRYEFPDAQMMLRPPDAQRMPEHLPLSGGADSSLQNMFDAAAKVARLSTAKPVHFESATWFAVRRGLDQVSAARQAKLHCSSRDCICTECRALWDRLRAANLPLLAQEFDRVSTLPPRVEAAEQQRHTLRGQVRRLKTGLFRVRWSGLGRILLETDIGTKMVAIQLWLGNMKTMQEENKDEIIERLQKQAIQDQGVIAYLERQLREANRSPTEALIPDDDSRPLDTPRTSPRTQALSSSAVTRCPDSVASRLVGTAPTRPPQATPAGGRLSPKQHSVTPATRPLSDTAHVCPGGKPVGRATSRPLGWRKLKTTARG